ncbi:MAG: N-acyl homoserine lactonase family protein [Candidatus Bathyarchaeia archaeon]
MQRLPKAHNEAIKCMGVKIYPMNTGFIRVDKGAYITMGRGYGEEIDVPDWAFLVTDGKERILIDTGMCETERADWHHPGSRQPEGYRIDERLRELGIEPEDIDAVVFTHLHWDHCSNMKLFRNAKFYVHRRELQFALDPHPLYLKSYESKRLGVTPPFDGVDFEEVSSEYRLRPYITIFPTPGHSPGHQSVAVETDDGVYVIAGDAVFSDENLEPDGHRGLPFTPMGRYVDVFDMFDSMERIFRRTGPDRIFPGHGRNIGRRPVYP